MIKFERVCWVLTLLVILGAWVAGTQRARDSLLNQLHVVEPSLTGLELVTRNVYTACSDYGLVHVALDEYPGYGGPVRVAVVVDESGLIRRLAVMEARETSSYLDNVIRTGLVDAFAGRRLKDLPEVDSISGATMTSEAILRGIEGSSGRIRAARSGLVYADPPRPVSRKELVNAGLVTGLFILALWVGSRRFPWSRKWGRGLCQLLGFVILGILLATQPSLSTVVLLLSGLWTNGLASYTAMLCLILGMVVLLYTGNNLYCRMICPFGALQQGLGGIFKPKAPALRPWARWIARLLALAVIGFGLYYRAPGNAAYEPFSWVFSFIGSGLMFAVGVIAIATSLFVLRPWCMTLCPIKAIYDYLKFGRKWLVSSKPEATK